MVGAQSPTQTESFNILAAYTVLIQVQNVFKNNKQLIFIQMQN